MISPLGKENNYVDKLIITGIYDSLIKEGNSGLNNLLKMGVYDL